MSVTQSDHGDHELDTTQSMLVELLDAESVGEAVALTLCENAWLIAGLSKAGFEMETDAVRLPVTVADTDGDKLWVIDPVREGETECV